MKMKLVFFIFMLPLAAKAQVLQCKGEVDSGANYFVSADLDSDLQIKGALFIKYSDNDGFEFQGQAQPQKTQILPLKIIDISGAFNGGLFQLRAPYFEALSVYRGNIIAHGNMGESLDVELDCRLITGL